MRHVRRLDPARGHEQKVAHATEASARLVAEQASELYHARMEAYHCVICGLWHVGHTISAARRRRAQHSRMGLLMQDLRDATGEDVGEDTGGAA